MNQKIEIFETPTYGFVEVIPEGEIDFSADDPFHCESGAMPVNEACEGSARNECENYAHGLYQSESDSCCLMLCEDCGGSKSFRGFAFVYPVGQLRRRVKD